MSLFTLLNEMEPENCDKLLETYAIRVSITEKERLDAMPHEVKAMLNKKVRELIDFYAYIGAYRKRREA